MDVAQAFNIPPPSYHEVAPPAGGGSTGVPPVGLSPSYLGPPPPYSSQEELWTALQQTDADGSSSTSLDLPPSYEEVIAGLSRETGETAPTSPLQEVPPPVGLTGARHSWHGATARYERHLVHIAKPSTGANRGYGFAFRDGHVTVVLPNSAAQHAGLTEGCRLVEVNGTNVEGHNKDFICDQIKQNAEGVSLLVEPPSKSW